jgi:hypothetical protein
MFAGGGIAADWAIEAPARNRAALAERSPKGDSVSAIPTRTGYFRQQPRNHPPFSLLLKLMPLISLITGFMPVIHLTMDYRDKPGNDGGNEEIQTDAACVA